MMNINGVMTQHGFNLEKHTQIRYATNSQKKGEQIMKIIGHDLTSINITLGQKKKSFWMREKHTRELVAEN